jgi:hypothetical protein
VAEAAAAVPVPKFVPVKGVKIETDPKANKEPSRFGDDDSYIDDTIKQLEVCRASCLFPPKFPWLGLPMLAGQKSSMCRTNVAKLGGQDVPHQCCQVRSPACAALMLRS